MHGLSVISAADLLTYNTLFTQHPLAVDMVIDILTDRGFFVAHVGEERVSCGLLPCHLDNSFIMHFLSGSTSLESPGCALRYEWYVATPMLVFLV